VYSSEIFGNGTWTYLSSKLGFEDDTV